MSLEDRIHWALTHGIAMGLNIPDREFAEKIPVIHTPFTMNPFPFPRCQFEKAVSLAQLFNILVEKITRNSKWLIETLEPTAVSDSFIFRLIDIYKNILVNGTKQPFTLAINRSDYMLHSKEGDTRSLLQVELNTIASSFGSLSTKISEMHIMMNEIEQLDSVENQRDIPINSALDEIASGLAAAHHVYLSQTGMTNLNCSVAMIVQPGERNFADQRLLQYQLWKNHRVRCFRVTLAEVHLKGKVGGNEELLIDSKCISVVYFRAGYTPDDFPTEYEWSARLLIEKSFAIKCPTIAVHLAGCKKIQQVLAEPGVLEIFISSPEQRELLRSVFAGLYSLSGPVINSSETSSQSQLLSVIKEKVQADNGLNFVMKPQREGGGNNFYGPDVAEALRTMPLDQQAAYILMERILPPSSRADLIRDGKVYSVRYHKAFFFTFTGKIY